MARRSELRRGLGAEKQPEEQPPTSRWLDAPDTKGEPQPEGAAALWLEEPQDLEPQGRPAPQSVTRKESELQTPVAPQPQGHQDLEPEERPHREDEKRPALSIVIPVFNEEKKIDADLEAALAYFRAQPYSFELIVVDDGSSDGTAARLAVWEQRAAPHLRAICYRPNRGKGCAVRTGMLAARGERRMFVDAGLCVPFSETARGLDALAEGHDVAIGSRKLGASRVARRQSVFRHWASRLLGPIVLRLMGLHGFRDTQCGFKFFTARAAEELFGRSRIDGFMFDAEILVTARRTGLQICEFPVEWRADPDSRYRPLAGGLRNLVELARIRFS